MGQSVDGAAQHGPVDGVDGPAVVGGHHVGVRVQLVVAEAQALDAAGARRLRVREARPQEPVVIRGPVLVLRSIMVIIIIIIIIIITIFFIFFIFFILL